MAETDQAGTQRSPRVEIFLSLLDLLKSAFWPGLAFIVFVTLFSPLDALVTELPGLLGRADVITLGQLNIKLNNALAAQATQSVRNGLQGLTGASAHRLLELTYPNDYCVANANDSGDEMAQELATDRALENLQMVTLTPQPPQGGSQCYEVAATDLGKKTQNILLAILTEALTSKS